MYCTCKKSVHVYSVKNNREVPGALTTWLRLLCLHPSLLGPLPPSGWDPPPLECAPLAGFVFLWRGHTHSWALPDFELDLSGATCVRPRDSRGHPRLCPAPPARQPGRPPWPPVPHHSPGCGARGGFLPRHDEDLREPLVRTFLFFSSLKLQNL